MPRTLEYRPVSEAANLPGLRLVLNGGVPGPWSEAAKAVFRVKGIDFVPVAHEGGSENTELVAWTGIANAPVAMFADERPRAHWSEILLLAERLAPLPRLIPEDEAGRVLMMGLAHEICGEDGLGWNRRLQMLDSSEASARNKAAEKAVSAASEPNERIDRMRHRYSPNAENAAAERRIVQILAHLDAALADNRLRASKWLVGEHLTAADIYWAAFANLFAPLPPEICPMPTFYRTGAEQRSAEVTKALTPALLEHRDRVAALCFEAPMRF